MITEKNIADFFKGYLHAALWSSSHTFQNDETGEEGETVELDKYDWADGEAEKLKQDCLDFIADYGDWLEAYAELRPFNREEGTLWEYIGHDFWLNRNGHGCGFWDRGCGAVGDQLSQLVGHGTPYAGIDLYLDSDDPDSAQVCADHFPTAYVVQYRDMSTAVHHFRVHETLEAARHFDSVLSETEQPCEFPEARADYEIDYRNPPVYWYGPGEALHRVRVVNNNGIPDKY